MLSYIALSTTILFSVATLVGLFLKRLGPGLSHLFTLSTFCVLLGCACAAMSRRSVEPTYSLILFVAGMGITVGGAGLLASLT
jgi:hypothetical protein